VLRWAPISRHHTAPCSVIDFIDMGCSVVVAKDTERLGQPEAKLVELGLNLLAGRNLREQEKKKAEKREEKTMR
jgi:hypothetical protein